jgi:glucose/arabinose dehydrogenase
MEFAPDGRLFVAQKTGELRVINRDGNLLSRPFLTVNPNTAGERGLLGVAFDPNFATNGYVYIYYTAREPVVHNRVSRFRADPQNPNIALNGSGTPILDLNRLQSDRHNGGAIHFGTDGKLYVAVGDNVEADSSQRLGNLLGKMLRINKDGTIPTDNPFYDRATGKNRAIWARGLRNPFTFGVNPDTGRIFINDVGEQSWEEINRGVKGANYGWPAYEGPENDRRYMPPIFAYRHGSTGTTGCAIVGGAFYNPQTVQFPDGYVGDYFFGDLCSGWIRRYDPGSDRATAFASGISGLVDIKVSEDGDLYYLSRGSGSVRKISTN